MSKKQKETCFSQILHLIHYHWTENNFHFTPCFSLSLDVLNLMKFITWHFGHEFEKVSSGTWNMNSMSEGCCQKLFTTSGDNWNHHKQKRFLFWLTREIAVFINIWCLKLLICFFTHLIIDSINVAFGHLLRVSPKSC